MHVGGTKSLFMQFGLAPISSKLATVSRAFEVTAVKIFTLYVVLRKKYATWGGPSSNCTLRAFCLVGGEVRIFVLALVSGLIFLPGIVAISVTVPLCVWDVLDESFCFTSKKTASVDSPMEQKSSSSCPCI